MARKKQAICPACGGKNPGDSKFCGYCGANLEDAGNEKTKAADQEPVQEKPVVTEAADAAKKESVITEPVNPEPVVQEEPVLKEKEKTASESLSEEASLNQKEAEEKEEVHEMEASFGEEKTEEAKQMEDISSRPIESEPQAKVLDAEFEPKPSFAEPSPQPLSAAKAESGSKKNPAKVKKEDFRILLEAAKDPMKMTNVTMTQAVLSLCCALIANLFLFTGILRALINKLSGPLGMAADLLGYGSLLGSNESPLSSLISNVSVMDRIGASVSFTAVILVLLMVVSGVQQYLGTKKVDIRKTFLFACQSLMAPTVLVILGVILAGIFPIAALGLLLAAFITVIMVVYEQVPREWNGWIRIALMVVVTAIVLAAGVSGIVRVTYSAAGEILIAAARGLYGALESSGMFR